MLVQQILDESKLGADPAVRLWIFAMPRRRPGAPGVRQRRRAWPAPPWPTTAAAWNAGWRRPPAGATRPR
ncbi:hypothetical protein LP419_03595 [Massilia sp. H-1]|nr:hypothetical protein LP419_03595 [Massilia sp. H-1]